MRMREDHREIPRRSWETRLVVTSTGSRRLQQLGLELGGNGASAERDLAHEQLQFHVHRLSGEMVEEFDPTRFTLW